MKMIKVTVTNALLKSSDNYLLQNKSLDKTSEKSSLRSEYGFFKGTTTYSFNTNLTLLLLLPRCFQQLQPTKAPSCAPSPFSSKSNPIYVTLPEISIFKINFSEDILFWG